MTAVATDWGRLTQIASWTAANTAASDRPDWNTDQVKMACFNDTAFNAAGYDVDTFTAYGAAPFTTGNGEVTGTGYTAGGVVIGSVAAAEDPVTHSTVLTAADVTIGAGVTLAQTIRMLVVYTNTPTTKWILEHIDCGADFPVIDPGILTIQWPDVVDGAPLANTMFWFD